MASWRPDRSTSPPAGWCAWPTARVRARGSISRSPTPIFVRHGRSRPAGRPSCCRRRPTARLGLSEGTVSLSDISGTVAGTSIGGRLAVGLQQPMRIDGDIELAAIELPAALAAAIGTPAQQRERGALVRRAVRAAFGDRSERAGRDQIGSRHAHAQARGARRARRAQSRRLGARARGHRRRAGRRPHRRRADVPAPRRRT